MVIDEEDDEIEGGFVIFGAFLTVDDVEFGETKVVVGI